MDNDSVPAEPRASATDAAPDEVRDALRLSPKQCPQCGYTCRGIDLHCVSCGAEFVGAFAPAAMRAGIEHKLNRARAKGWWVALPFARPVDQSRQFGDALLFPAMLLLLAAVAVGLGVSVRIPSRDNLTEVQGSLASYHYSARNNVTVLRLQGGPSIWTDAVPGEGVDRVFANNQPVTIRAFVDPHSTAGRIEQAVRSYGLYVNGRTVRTVEAALAHERFLLRVCYPATGVAFIWFAFVAIRWQTRRG